MAQEVGYAVIDCALSLKEFTLNNAYPVDFMMKDGGFSRLDLQGFV